MDITLKYDEVGGTTKPNDETKTLEDGETIATFTLAAAIEKSDDPDGRSNSFGGWDINGTVYKPGEDFVADSAKATVFTAKAVWNKQKTTVSPKAYGYSPNGTKNALGTTRFHHQQGYPRPMGV